MDSLTCIPVRPDSTPMKHTPLDNATQQTRNCHVCQQPCSDPSMIRALGEVYHYDCFTCEDCHTLVADKFYALNNNQDPSKFKIVCENHYCYAQVGGTLCLNCRLPLIKPLSHTHLTQLGEQCRCQSSCPGCLQQSTQSNEACYEYGGQVYCLLHFSGIKETQCFGCHQAILKKFVDHKSHPGKKWHPECYMIYKFWNVRLADVFYSQDNAATGRLDEIHSAMQRKVNRIWTDLSSFEESSATCISDMLLLVAAGAYVEGFRMACQFVMHLQVLYGALDDIEQQLVTYHKVIPCVNEAKLVCNQAIRFFNILAQPNKTMDTNLAVTQELLPLVTSLAQNLKTLIRIGLTEALYLERDCHVADAISRFLDSLLELERKRVWIGGRYWFKEEPFPKLPLDYPSNDTTLHTDQQWWKCFSCQQPIDADCYRHVTLEQWHPSCFSCTSCHSHLANNLILACLKTDPTSGAKDLLCYSCANITTIHSQQNDTTTSLFTHQSQLQNHLHILKLALTQLYVTMNSASETMSNKTIYEQHSLKRTGSTSPLLPVTFLPASNDTNNLQQPTRQTPSFGHTNLGNIKRARSTHLDRISENSQDSHITVNTTDLSSSTLPRTNATTPKRSLTQYEPIKQSTSYHQNSIGISSSSSLSSISSSPTALYVQQNEIPSFGQRSSKSPLATSPTNSTGIFSTTRRASTNAILRMGSLRRTLSKKRDTDGGSIYSLFDRRQSQKQRNIGRNLRISTTEPCQSSTISFHSISSIDSPIATTPLSIMQHVSPHQHLLPLSPKQYVVVRYSAAKAIASFAPNMYTPEEWMLLVQCRKQSLWRKFKTRIRAPSPSSSTSILQQQQQPHQKVFGVSLGTLNPIAYRSALQQQDNQGHILHRYGGMHNLDNDDSDSIDMDRTMVNQATTQWMVSCFTSVHCKVSLFVQHCILVLLQRDLSVEGIFRKNGNIRELKQIESTIDQDISIDSTITVNLLVQQTSIQLAALLKRYLRELPEPLLTFKLYPVFVAAVGLETEEETKAMLHLACCMLPKENRDTMQVVFGFFQHVSTFKDINKMGIYNLARIMAPSVLHERGHSGQDISSTSVNNSSILTDRTPNEEIKVVEMLIRYHDEFGKVPTDMIPLITDPQMVDWVASMDTKQFMKSNLHVLPYPSRFQPLSVPTLSTTSNSSEAALSPITPATMGRRQSINITPRSQPSLLHLIPESPTTKSLHRRSWMLRKQRA